MKRTLLAIILTVSFVLPAACCKKDSSKSHGSSPAATHVSGGGSSSLDKAKLRVSDGAGKHVVTLRPRGDGGFDRLGERGQVIGRVKVQSDRVKVLDTSDKQLAKVKYKSDGIKIYGVGASYVAKGQWRGGKLRLKDPAGNKFAYLQNSSCTVKGSTIDVKRLGQMMLVKRDGKAVAKVSQTMVPAIAAVFGLTEELTPEQRTALVVYLMKIGR